MVDDLTGQVFPDYPDPFWYPYTARILRADTQPTHPFRLLVPRDYVPELFDRCRSVQKPGSTTKILR